MSCTLFDHFREILLLTFCARRRRRSVCLVGVKLRTSITRTVTNATEFGVPAEQQLDTSVPLWYLDCMLLFCEHLNHSIINFFQSQLKKYLFSKHKRNTSTMKNLVAFFLSVFLFGHMVPVAAAKLDLQELIAKTDEAYKQFPSNPELMKDVLADDAVLCFEEECSPFLEAWEPMFKGVKTFDYIKVVRAMGERMATGRCYDYLDYHDKDCHTMFYSDWVLYWNEEGKITKHVALMDHEQHANLFKCVAEAEVKASGETKV